ncbi:MAG: mechanosensitive ion channel family protein [Gammaproteobacteria bacterium]|nr:mechanosensitive ion channel family protein [Gammaproteobacteria bacterium]MDH3767266.1 mechanosensitive ion channel family protein [Gammaproteobacteria bacterium]
MIEKILALDPLILNIATIAVEIVVVAIAFVILNWILKRIISAIIAAPALARWQGIAKKTQANLRTLLFLLATLLILGVIGANLYLMYLGKNLPQYTLELVRGIPRQFWIDTGIALAKILGLVIAATIVLRYVRRVLAFLSTRTKAFEGLAANDESIEKFFGALSRTLSVAAWLMVLALAAAWLGLPAAVYAFIMLVLRIFLIISVGILILRALGALIDSADALSAKYITESKFAGAYERLRSLVKLFRRSIEYVVMVMVATLVVMQVDAIAPLAEWGPRIIRIIGIIFLARLVIVLAHYLIEELLINKAELTKPQRQRRQTLVPLYRSIIAYAVYFFAGVMIIREVGINPTPVLAGAGIFGLAVGLGAQNLINDVVSGFFLLFEEHFLVGDFIKIGEAEGIVELIDLRTTRIRDNAGRHHIIRNGQISELINYSKDYTHAVVEVGVAYESDLNKVFDVLKTTGEELKAENDMALEATSVKGLDNFAESQLLIRTVTRVKPGCHLEVERDLRRRIKIAFDENGIEIPYSRRVMIMRKDGEPVPE